MELINTLLHKVDLFLLIFARISGLMLIAPFYGSMNIPAQIKIGLGGLISLILLNMIKVPTEAIPNQLLSYLLVLASEMMVGFIIGFIAYLVFIAIQLAGQSIDMQMGFGIVNVIDPQFGMPVPLMGNFKYILALLVFLTSNAHYFLLTALFNSYQMIPLTGFAYTGNVAQGLLQMFNGVFITALKISLPILAVLFVTELVLGLLARTVPQMNIFMVGMPLKIVVGMMALFLALPFYILLLGYLFDQSYSDILYFLKGSGGK